jgi:hypothetical protein
VNAHKVSPSYLCCGASTSIKDSRPVNVSIHDYDQNQ